MGLTCEWGNVSYNHGADTRVSPILPNSFGNLIIMLAICLLSMLFDMVGNFEVRHDVNEQYN